ncbi:MAG: GYDIA family GHMP kinase [Bacteroidota bacterium]
MTPTNAITSKTYHAAGKLMLLGEYLVLHGAKCLAFPLKFGQELKVGPIQEVLEWSSHSPSGKWFSCKMNGELNILESTNDKISEKLQQVFYLIKQRKPELDLTRSFEIKANFNLNWGFGSSSTLVSLLSQWSRVDGYDILENTFGGSGYDIACAQAESPITYQIMETGREVKSVKLNPEITDKLLFVYHGHKQNTAEDVRMFKSKPINNSISNTVSSLTDRAIKATSIEELEEILNESEDALESVLGRSALKKSAFTDYPYSIKSLGAWGGDFFLATFLKPEEAESYFKNKGYDTMFYYNQIAL